jgi:fatty-acyl-CoA synthase
METPLTPLNFMRRARKLYGGRLAVVDGEMRLTYAQFGERGVLRDSVSAKATGSPPYRRIRTNSWSSSTASLSSARSSCR